MLAACNADLVRRDPALPGLATLLDPEALAAALHRALPGPGPASARITYLKYRPGRKCLAGCRLAFPGTTLEASATAYPPGSSKFLAVCEQAHVVLHTDAVVVSFFPSDGRLNALPFLADGDSRHRLLVELLPDRPDLWQAELQPLVYRPRRRYVAKLLSGGAPRAVLKVYAESGYPAARASAAAFAPRGPLRLAPLLGASDRHRIVASGWLTGRSLYEALGEATFDLRDMTTVGAAVAELHAQDPPGLRQGTRKAEATSLLKVADRLGFVCPHLARRVQDFARQLADCLAQGPPLVCPIHGDLSPKQVLIDRGAVAVIDFDEATRGDPLADLGNFIAKLERAALRGEISPGRAEAMADAFLEGYRVALPLHRLRLYTAAGLLRLAPHAFLRLEPDWPERIEMILARGETILEASHAIAR